MHDGLIRIKESTINDVSGGMERLAMPPPASAVIVNRLSGNAIVRSIDLALDGFSPLPCSTSHVYPPSPAAFPIDVALAVWQKGLV